MARVICFSGQLRGAGSLCQCQLLLGSSAAHTAMESQNIPKSEQSQCIGVYLEFGQILLVLE